MIKRTIVVNHILTFTRMVVGWKEYGSNHAQVENVQSNVNSRMLDYP